MEPARGNPNRGPAIALLPEPERWLLDQFFWHHRTEAGIAAELHEPGKQRRDRSRLSLWTFRSSGVAVPAKFKKLKPAPSYPGDL